MTECFSQQSLFFHPKRRVDATFDAPEISSDGGVVLLRLMDDRLGLGELLANALPDDRAPARIKHSRREQVRQRLYQIALGYEDCNDADSLRHDAMLKMACDRLPDDAEGLSSQPTLSRFENAVSMKAIKRMLLDFEKAYVDSLSKRCQLVVLDIDTTDDETHGRQQLTFFHGYYDQHMYHPQLIFDEDGELVTAILRPGNTHAARGAKGVLNRIIRAIRKRCPHAEIVVRADSGYGHFHYAAKTWSRKRRVIVKAEHSLMGANPRFVVTSYTAKELGAEDTYRTYCARGQCENFIKDLKNAMKADRLSCSTFVANFFRLLLHAAAYRLMFALRDELAVERADMGSCQLDTLRLRLLKIGAMVRQSVRRILVRMPEVFPLADAFMAIAARLSPSPDTS